MSHGDQSGLHVEDFRTCVSYVFLKTCLALKWHQTFSSTLLFDEVMCDYVSG